MAATGAMPVAAATPATPLMWAALLLAVATTLGWLLRRPGAQARWPRIALLVFASALAVQLAVDLGSGHSSLRMNLLGRFSGLRTVSLGTMITCYLAALAASAWGAWTLLRRR